MKKRIHSICSSLTALVLIFSGLDLNSRPGGGSSYRSSSSSSSYRSSSSSSSSYRSSSSSSSSYRSSSSSSSSSSNKSSSYSYAPPVKTEEEKEMDKLSKKPPELNKFSQKIKLKRDSSLIIQETVSLNPDSLNLYTMYSLSNKPYVEDVAKDDFFLFSNVKFKGVPLKLNQKFSNINCDKKFCVSNNFLLGPNYTALNQKINFEIEYNLYRALVFENNQFYYRYPIVPIHAIKKNSISNYEVEFPFQLRKGTEYKILDFANLNIPVETKTIQFDTNKISGVAPNNSETAIYILEVVIPKEEIHIEELTSDYYDLLYSNNRIDKFISETKLNLDGSLEKKLKFENIKSSTSTEDFSFSIFLKKYQQILSQENGARFFYDNLKCISKDCYVSDSSSNKEIISIIKPKENNPVVVEFNVYDSFFELENKISILIENRNDEYSYNSKSIKSSIYKIQFPKEIPKEEINTKIIRFDFLNLGKLYWEDNVLVIEEFAVTENSKIYIEIDFPKKYLVPMSFLKNSKLKFKKFYYEYTFVFYLFGLFVNVFILRYAVKKIRFKWSDFQSQKEIQVITSNVKKTGLVQLKNSDPDFSEEGFLERVKQTANLLTDAWLNDKMQSVRSLVSSGVYSRFKSLLELMKQDKIVNMMADWEIKNLSIVGVETGISLHTIHVLLEGKARDANLSLEIPKEERLKQVSKMQENSYTEVWSFVRGTSAKTKKDFGFFSNNCPNCGAPAKSLTDSNKCSSCGSIFNSGEFDWVLSEITQTVEWDFQANQNPENKFKDILNKFKSISFQTIEDKATTLFWKWITAKKKGDRNLLSRDSAEKVTKLDIYAPVNLSDVAVGSTDLKKLFVRDKKMISILLIKWSASYNKQESIYSENYIEMELDIDSYEKIGLGEHGCKTCGAPLPEKDSKNCEYCNAEIPSKLKDWLLVDLRRDFKNNNNP